MNDKKDTLLILTPGFPDGEADAACLPPLQVFIRSLKENYPDVDLLILSLEYPFKKAIYQWRGALVISFGGRNKSGLRRLLLWRSVTKRLKEIAAEKKIIGVISFWCNECALIGKRFATAHPIPHRCWILGQDAKKENTYVKRIAPNAAELVALSDFIADEFEKNHRIRPAHIIPPGIDTHLFDTTIPEKDIDILAAGSLITLKHYDIFLQVIAEIKTKQPGIKAVLAGGGPEKEKLQQLISALALEQNVSLIGELPHDQVLRLMQRTKIFLHPSSYEGFGVVCIEALYAGCSVISFCRPMKEDIRNWHIVTDKEAMTKKTLELLQAGGNNEPVLFNPSSAAAQQFMKLFGY